MQQKTVTVQLVGGLGNQLFQIATAYGVAKTVGAQFLLCGGTFGGCGQGSHPSKYYDSLYNWVPRANHLPVEAVVHERHWSAYPALQDDVAGVLHAHETTTVAIKGWFQSDLHFKQYRSEIRDLFRPPRGVFDWLETHTALFTEFPELREGGGRIAFMGVRRGDYLKTPAFHKPCGMTYYKAAMERVKADRYYVFSDDMDWCRSHFVGEQFRFVSLGDDLHDFMAALVFPHYIIGNSSYHWWASYLSVYTDAAVVAPDQWLSESGYETVYREGWTVLARPVEV